MKKIILKLLKNYPTIIGFPLAILKKVYPIFLFYPINPKPRYGFGKPVHKKLNEIIKKNDANYQRLLADFLKFKKRILSIPTEKEKSLKMPYWENVWFTGLDGITLYGFLAKFQPKRYFEIGSGISTKFAKKAIDDFQLKTEIISFDPAPREEINRLCQRVVKKPLEEISLKIFNQLEAGDILLVDNSHYLYANSDVSSFFLDILPNLKRGVIIGLHDIYLPYDYPPEPENYYYAEQYLLASWLLAQDDKLEIIFPTYYICQNNNFKKILRSDWHELKIKKIPFHGGSFWLRTK
jgi:hypothetical protein